MRSSMSVRGQSESQRSDGTLEGRGGASRVGREGQRQEGHGKVTDFFAKRRSGAPESDVDLRTAQGCWGTSIALPRADNR